MNNGSHFSPNADIPGRIMLDEVEVRQESNEILIDGKTVRLKPKVMAVLMQLIEARGRGRHKVTIAGSCLAEHVSDRERNYRGYTRYPPGLVR